MNIVDCAVKRTWLTASGTMKIPHTCDIRHRAMRQVIHHVLKTQTCPRRDEDSTSWVCVLGRRTWLGRTIWASTRVHGWISAPLTVLH